MKNAMLYVFSGTGNTMLIATQFQQELQKHDYQTKIYNISKPYLDIPNPNDYDLIGFGYPIYAFNAPKVCLDFIKQLPNTNGVKTFIFKTSGEPFWLNNASSYSMIKQLKHKGYVPFFEEHLLMPYYIMFRYPTSIAKYMYEFNVDYIPSITNAITSHTQHLPRFSIFTYLCMLLGRIQWLGAKINGPLMTVDHHKCNNCNQCIKDCPTKSIKTKNGYPHFDYTCAMCMKCVSFCPQDAIRPGVLRPFKVYGRYPFESDTMQASPINKQTKGYFKLFNRYYRNAKIKMQAWLNIK